METQLKLKITMGWPVGSQGRLIRKKGSQIEIERLRQIEKKRQAQKKVTVSLR